MNQPTQEDDSITADDNLKNCRNCRWHRFNLPAMPAVVWNCTHPHTRGAPDPIGPLNARIDEWIDANVDDFDDTGMPTHARDCPGWAP